MQPRETKHDHKAISHLKCGESLPPSFVWAAPAEARVTKIIVDSKVSPALLRIVCRQSAGNAADMPDASATPYQRTLTGRAFGELDPTTRTTRSSPTSTLAPRMRRARSSTSPPSASQADGHGQGQRPDVARRAQPRRQRRIHRRPAPQGDIAPARAPGRATTPAPRRVPANAIACRPTRSAEPSNEWVKMPVLAGVTGKIFGRIINRSGARSAPLNVMGNPIPYFPVDATTTPARR